ncbi:hypothetical protein ES703_114221 [subsurface metagenome]
MKKLDLIMAGVGGQGIILASDIVSEAALAAGYDVKKTDTLGMAQRGGSVISHVRIAPQVWSPLIKKGEVDVLVAFEKLEAARWSHYLRPGGITIVNSQALPPLSVSLGSERYPSDEEIVDTLKQQTDRLYIVDGTSRVRELGNTRALNMFMLGCLSLFMPFKVHIWRDSLRQRIPPKVHKINITAFNQGREELRGDHL